MLTKTLVLAWWLTVLSGWSPPDRPHHLPDAQESVAAAQDRYLSIAQDALSVALDPEEAPLFPGPRGRVLTAGLLLSVAMTESGFRRDVDLGVGPRARGDGGRSWCLMQVQAGAGRIQVADPLLSTWMGRDLVADRTKCFRAGLHLLRLSMNACSQLALRHRLSAYTSGTCSATERNSMSKMSVFARLWARIPSAWTDAGVTQALTPVTP